MAPKTKSNPKGAGRKLLGKVRLVVKVEPDTARKIRELVESPQCRCKTLGEVIDDRMSNDP